MPSKTDWWGRLMFWTQSLLESTRRYVALMGLSDQTSSQSTNLQDSCHYGHHHAIWEQICCLPGCKTREANKCAPLGGALQLAGIQCIPPCLHLWCALWWDPANERIINHLKLGHSYFWLMRKLMFLDAIQWSCDIYIEHLLGVREQQQEDTGGTRSV